MKRTDLVARRKDNRFVTVHESLLGPKRRSRNVCSRAAVGGEADVSPKGLVLCEYTPQLSPSGAIRIDGEATMEAVNLESSLRFLLSLQKPASAGPTPGIASSRLLVALDRCQAMMRLSNSRI